MRSFRRLRRHFFFWASLVSGLAATAPAYGQNTPLQVCQRWTADRADVSEGTSTADIATCDAGDLLPPGRPNSLKLVNLYRFLAGMPAVTEDPTFDSNAQACAIIQAANSLSHSVTTSATCYTATGASASSRSSICSGQSVGCIDLYMNDGNGGPGFGHRTWIFANSLGPVGFGSVGNGGRSGMTGSCFYQVGGTGKAGATFVAWPPPGPVPIAAITTTGVDKAGWSVQSDTINLTTATATVMDGTTNLAVTVTPNLPSYGARYAMGILPNGWTSQAGHNYAVAVGGTSISYTINVLDCAMVDGGTVVPPPSDAGKGGGPDATVSSSSGGSSGSSGGASSSSGAGSSSGSSSGGGGATSSSGGGSSGGGAASSGGGGPSGGDGGTASGGGTSSSGSSSGGTDDGFVSTPNSPSGCHCDVAGVRRGGRHVPGSAGAWSRPDSSWSGLLLLAGAVLLRRRRS